MGVETLVQRAWAFSAKYGIPLAKNQFEGTVEDPVPSLPYMVYMLPHDTGRGADNLNNLKARDFELELYTAADDGGREDLAGKIEKEIFRDAEYEAFLAPIREEECFQTAYEVRGLLTKITKKKGAGRGWTKKALF